MPTFNLSPKMKIIKSLFALAAAASSTNVLAVGRTLDIPAHPGWAVSHSCVASPKGGLTAPGNGLSPCIIEIPIPLSGSNAIDQVAVSYGVDGSGPISIDAELRYRELKTVANTTSVDHDSPFSWSDHTSGKSTSSTYTGLLMTQFGPGSHPDEFQIGVNNTYYVRVTLASDGSPGSKPEFFGLTVTYYSPN